MYQCKILADSVSYAGARLTTFECTYPRFVHSELLTHRMLSRNSASSRAIPIQSMIQRMIDDPVEPIYWGSNKKGMVSGSEIDDVSTARTAWLGARDNAVNSARALADMGIHKQLANRILEPWMWITTIISATEWDNFFNLRCHPDAQPEIQKIAYMMRDLYEANTPALAMYHLPLLQEDDISLDGKWDHLKRICAGRCARVSYLTHDGRRDIQADIDLCNSLVANGHWSPLEHVATASLFGKQMMGNFRGWMQFRKEFPSEAVRLPTL